ncbi:MAG: polyprenyl synthetase family protein [bacterium]
MDLVDFKTTFDGVLQTYIEQKIALSVDLLDNKRLKKIMEYIQTFIFSGGKRLRPYCVRAVYTGLGGREEKEIIKFAVMFEVFHAMALIHDDIIDSADKRHNVSTMHGFVETLLDDVRDKHHAAE